METNKNMYSPVTVNVKDSPNEGGSKRERRIADPAYMQQKENGNEF